MSSTKESNEAADREFVVVASRLPVELVLAIPMPDRSAARREEARIKRLSRLAKLALVNDQREAEA